MFKSCPLSGLRLLIGCILVLALSACTITDRPIQNALQDSDPIEFAMPAQSSLLEGENSWLPPPPMPDDYDWVRLTSGEWLKGEVITLYEDKLEFDSDGLGVLKIDEEDIAELRSKDRKSLRFSNGTVLIGQIYIRGEQLSLIGSGPRVYKRSSLISIANVASEGEAMLWDAELSVGANRRQGNVNQTDFSLGFDAIRRTASNRLHLTYQGDYTEIDSTETDNSHRLTGQYDLFFSQRAFFRPASFELFRDPFQNIAARITYSVGGGYSLRDDDTVKWDISSGLGFQSTRFDTVAAGEDERSSTPVLEAGTDYERDITDDLTFHFLYNSQFVNSDSGRYNHHLESGLSIDVIGDLDFSIRYIWDRISNPTPDAEGIRPDKDDTRLILGVDYDF